MEEIHKCGYWDEHPDYTVARWIQAATWGFTRLGYWDWVGYQIDTESKYRDLMIGEGDGQEDS